MGSEMCIRDSPHRSTHQEGSKGAESEEESIWERSEDPSTDGRPSYFGRSSRLDRVTHNPISFTMREESLQRSRQRRILGHPQPPPFSLEQARRRRDEGGKIPKVPEELEHQLPEARRGTGHRFSIYDPSRIPKESLKDWIDQQFCPQRQIRRDRQPGPRAMKETRGCL